MPVNHVQCTVFQRVTTSGCSRRHVFGTDSLAASVAVTKYTEMDRNGMRGHWKQRNGPKRTGKGTNGRCMEAARRTEMVDMEVNMRVEKSHSQEQPQYNRSAYRGLEKHIHKQMMNQLTAKSYNSLAHRIS